MVTYSNLGHFGRLGNQMFQIASTIGIALDNGSEYCFNRWICSYTSSNFNNFMKTPLNSGTLRKPISHIQEHGFNHTKLVLNKDINYKLFGYFQSEKYFKHHRGHILNVFTLGDNYLSKLEEKYSDILENSCSLHIRRGDYIGLQDHHTLVGVEYYKKALHNIYGDDLSKVNILVFSDDIRWCKESLQIPNTNIHFIANNIDIMDLYLMSLCTNNIIANSSFSWWGAWLNQNEDKKVVAPKNWFGPHNSHLPTKDLLCEDWIII